MSGYLEVPVEAAHVDSARVSPVILERRVVYDVDDRTDDSAGVQGDTVQQWFQPTWRRENTPRATCSDTHANINGGGGVEG